MNEINDTQQSGSIDDKLKELARKVEDNAKIIEKNNMIIARLLKEKGLI